MKKNKNRLAYKHTVSCMVSLCVRTRSRWRTAVSASVGLWTTSRLTRGPSRRSRSTVYWPTSSSCWWSALQSSVPAHLSWWSGCCQSCVPAVPIWLWSCWNKVGRIWLELIDWFIGVLHSICNNSAIIKGGFGWKGSLWWYCDEKEIQFENCQNQCIITITRSFVFSLSEIADTLCYLLVGTSEEEMHGVEVGFNFYTPIPLSSSLLPEISSIKNCAFGLGK